MTLKYLAIIFAVAGSLGLAAGGDEDPPKIDLADFQRLPKDVKTVLASAESMELYSLDPARVALKKGEAEFHGWKVLGKTPLKEAADRKKVRSAIEKGVAENMGVAGCFKPRHGLRVTHKDKTVDLVICFECLSMTIFIQEKGKKEKVAAVWTSPTPQPVLDKILKAAKVPLPPGPDDE